MGLFFSDILAAEWAARRSVRFQVRLIGELLHDIENPREWHPEYFIHPDSLPLLEGFTEEERAAMNLLGLWPREG